MPLMTQLQTLRRAPGGGAGEGSRRASTHMNGLAPVLAHATDDANATHERERDDDGNCRLHSLARQKRPCP
jgi:hypothetical protein